MPETMQVSAQRAWTHLKKYQPLIHELVSRDLKVKYRRSFLGYIWSILNPLLMMLVMYVVFSQIFQMAQMNRGDDAAAKHHLFVHVPQRYPKLPALPDLRQHPVYLFQ